MQKNTRSFIQSSMAFTEADLVSQLPGFVDEVSEVLEKGCQEDVLVMDFSKVLCKVSHSLPIHKLQQCGISLGQACS